MPARVRALITCGVVASTACASQQAGMAPDARAQDRAAIHGLYEQDIAATLANDPAAIADLWTDDIVLLAPNQPAQIGQQAIFAARQRQHAALPGFRVTSYVPELKSLTIADGWAFEWSVFTASYVETPGGEEKRLRATRLSVQEAARRELESGHRDVDPGRMMILLLSPSADFFRVLADVFD